MARVLILCVCGALLVGIGYVLGSKPGRPAQQTITEARSSASSKRSEVRVIERTKRPDGTVTEVIRETVQKEAKQETVARKEQTSYKQTQYRLGISYTPHLEDILDWRRAELSATASRRVFSGLWADVGFNFKRKELTLGLSYEF